VTLAVQATDLRTLSIPEFAEEIGIELKTVRAWTKRAVDPLPTVPAGDGGKGLRERRKVVMALYPAWIERNYKEL